MCARSRKSLLRTAVTVSLASSAFAAGAATASADGLPVLGVDVGSKGVVALTSPIRYVTLRAGRETLVARTALEGGRVLRFTRVPGTYTIPAVAYDGSASGLSADRSTLVLIQPRLGFPRARTAFAVLDAKQLRLRKIVTLNGDFSLDALSPRGTTMFLIQYTSAADPSRYNVRAYDLRHGRLLPKPVVDPQEHQNAMRGAPITRATSPDGRWAYTLYDGAAGTPFVHALDTSKRQARCIDLPVLTGRQDLWRLHVTDTAGGTELVIGTATRTLALVDTRNFHVLVPTAPVASKLASRPDTPIWVLAVSAALAALLAASALSLHALRRLRVDRGNRGYRGGDRRVARGSASPRRGRGGVRVS